MFLGCFSPGIQRFNVPLVTKIIILEMHFPVNLLASTDLKQQSQSNEEKVAY